MVRVRLQARVRVRVRGTLPLPLPLLLTLTLRTQARSQFHARFGSSLLPTSHLAGASAHLPAASCLAPPSGAASVLDSAARTTAWQEILTLTLT